MHALFTLLRKTAHQNSTGDQSAEQSVRRLLSSAALINQAVGDALSDLLFCEAVLRLKGWGCEVSPRVPPQQSFVRCRLRVCSYVYELQYVHFTEMKRFDVFHELSLLFSRGGAKGV